MTGEQFLNSIKCLDLEITALKHERSKIESLRQDLLEKAECLGASLTGVCVQHGVNSKTESLGVQLADAMTVEQVAERLSDYQDSICRRIKFLVGRKQQAQELIDKLPDAKHRALLKNRYISDMKWAMIADKMGYTDAYTRIDLKDQAIAAFDIIWQNFHHKPSRI